MFQVAKFQIYVPGQLAPPTRGLGQAPGFQGGPSVAHTAASAGPEWGHAPSGRSKLAGEDLEKMTKMLTGEIDGWPSRCELWVELGMTWPNSTVTLMDLVQKQLTIGPIPRSNRRVTWRVSGDFVCSWVTVIHFLSCPSGFTWEMRREKRWRLVWGRSVPMRIKSNQHMSDGFLVFTFFHRISFMVFCGWNHHQLGLLSSTRLARWQTRYYHPTTIHSHYIWWYIPASFHPAYQSYW